MCLSVCLSVLYVYLHMRACMLCVHVCLMCLHMPYESTTHYTGEALLSLPVSCNCFISNSFMSGLNNLLAAYEDKSAEAVCTFAYGSGDPKDSILLFKGVTPVRGVIIPPPPPPCAPVFPCTHARLLYQHQCLYSTFILHLVGENCSCPWAK